MLSQKQRNLNYRHSKVGRIKEMYRRQVRSSKSRVHTLPDYTIDELVEAVMDMDLYHSLYDDWKDSGYDKKLTPSLDRRYNDKPYTKTNIKLMTWGENHKNAAIDMCKVNIKTTHREIEQYTLEGVYIDTFKSISEAARTNNHTQVFIYRRLNNCLVKNSVCIYKYK